MKGRGEAYQSWNSDHAMATPTMTRPVMPAWLAPAGVGFGDKLFEIGLRYRRFYFHRAPPMRNGRGICSRGRVSEDQLIQPFSL